MWALLYHWETSHHFMTFWLMILDFELKNTHIVNETPQPQCVGEHFGAKCLNTYTPTRKCPY